MGNMNKSNRLQYVVWIYVGNHRKERQWSTVQKVTQMGKWGLVGCGLPHSQGVFTAFKWHSVACRPVWSQSEVVVGARPFNTPKICAVMLQLPYKTAFDRVQAHSLAVFLWMWFSAMIIHSGLRSTVECGWPVLRIQVYSVYRVKMTT